MDDLVTVYSILNDNYGDSIDHTLQVMAFALFTVGVLVLILVKFVRTQKQTKLEIYYLPVFFIVFSVLLFMLLGITGAEDDFDRMKDVYGNGGYEIVEGEVHVSHEQPKGGHAKGDVVIIDGKSYEIGYFDSKAGYKQTIAHGGCLKEGVYAKLYVYGDRILRIDAKGDEVGAGSVPTEPKIGFTYTWADNIWIFGIIVVNVLFFARKYVLLQNGYGLSMVDLGFDGARMWKVIENESSPRKQRMYMAINILIPALFILSLVLVFVLRLDDPLWGKVR